MFLKNKLDSFINYLVNATNSRVKRYGEQYFAFGLFGILNYPFAYLYRVYYSGLPELENLTLRSLATIFSILLLANKYWSDQYKKYLPLFWYFTLTFCIPYLGAYMLILNKFSLDWLMNTVVGLFILVILVDWVIFLFMFFVGSFFAAITYSGTHGWAQLHSNGQYTGLVLYLYLCVFIIGLIFLRNKEKYQLDSISLRDEMNQKLNDLVLEKSRDLISALNIKKNFLNNISHEFRTPLHTILTLSGELNTVWHKIDDNKRASFLSMIYNSAYGLSELVHNILDTNLYAFNNAVFNFHDCNFQELIARSINNNKAYAISSRKSIEFSFKYNKKLPVYVRCDEAKMQQVLNNLLSNAIKYSNDSGKIDINVSLGNYNELLFTICDDGIGIPAGEESLIFEIFAQSSKTRHNTASKGLGLNIVKKIIQGHNGNIWVSARETGGSCFSFTLPLSINTNIMPPKIDNFKNNKIIVCVDDEESSLISIEFLLNSLGYTVKPFLSPIKALNYVMSDYSNVSLIFLDLMMPEMYGLNFLKQIKNYKFTKHIKVVISSCVSDPKEKENARLLGASDFMNKPFTKADLEEKIKKHFNK